VNSAGPSDEDAAADDDHGQLTVAQEIARSLEGVPGPQPQACPVCALPTYDLASLAAHLVERADASDSGHVMWLNRNITKRQTAAEDLEPLLGAALEGGDLLGPRVER
jgi:hypothetical protein